MNAVRSIANKFEDLFKSFPALPAEIRKTLADYLYIIALVLGILGAFGVLIALGALGVAFGVLSAAGVAGIAGIAALIGLTVIAISSITTVLYFMAYKPLSQKLERGWLLLFLVSLIELVITVLHLLNFNLFSALWQVAQAGIAMYVLFQVRSYFGGAPAVVPPVPGSASKKPIDAQIIEKK